MSSIIHRSQSTKLQSNKAQLYARYLDSVRCAGLWHQPAPITLKGLLITSNQDPQDVAGTLIWSELIRKFLKHNPERHLIAEAATVDHSLHSALINACQQSDFDHDRSHVDDLPESGRIILPPSIAAEDQQHLTQLVNKLKDSCDKYPPSPGEITSRVAADANSASIILAFALYALGEFSQSLAILANCNFEIPTPSAPHIERYDFTLLVLGHTISALAHERNGADLPVSIKAYKRAGSTYIRCVTSLALKPPNEGDGEMHWWAEVGLYRYALNSRAASQDSMALEAHRLYHSLSRYWPASFRYAKRCVFYKSYLRLLLDLGKSGQWTPPPSTGSTTNLASSNVTLSSDISPQNTPYWSGWRTEVFTIERTYEQILKHSLSFPQSGSTNQAVLDFCDHIVEGWKIGDCDSEETVHVIDMLYRATQQTYHSQRILRYLIRLLSARQAYEEAAEALDLYVQLFTKAKETEAPKQSTTLQDIPQANGHAAVDVESDNSPIALDILEAGDRDSDADFIDTLVLGCRLWLKFLSDPEKAWRLISLASELIESKKNTPHPGSVKLEARVARFMGITAGAQAEMADRETRPALQCLYLKHLSRATELDPTSFETFYHLAFAQAEIRDIDAALNSARRAVDINPNNKNAWHLLGLLTTASKEPRLALDMIEVGLANEDEDLGDEGEPSTPRRRATTITSTVDGQSQIDALSISSAYQSVSGRATPLAGSNLATETAGIKGSPESFTDAVSTPREGSLLNVPEQATTTQQTSPVGTTPSKARDQGLEIATDTAEELEAIIQLRMSKNVIIELLDGPEVALTDQQALFAYFAHIAPQLKTTTVANISPYGSKAAAASTISISTANRPDPTTANGPTHSRSLIMRRKLRGRKASDDLKPPVVTAKPPHRAISLSLRSSRHVSAPMSEKAANNGRSGPKSDLGNGDVIGNGEVQVTETNARPNRLLQSLWLMSAATFRRWGKLDECRGAIREAELLDSDEPDVWVQFALYSLATSELEVAVESLSKALAFADRHVGAVVHLARILKEEGSLELAEGLLESLTEAEAWDVPEAWFLLSQIYEATDRAQRGRDCLIYALSLEQTKPLRPLRLTLPRCL